MKFIENDDVGVIAFSQYRADGVGPTREDAMLDLIVKLEALVDKLRERTFVVQRGGDFMAHLEGNKAVWEAGRTEDEAVGKLYRRLREES